MEIKANSSSGSALIAHCPYLGLYDDPATSLAYPSTWNYCYRAKPPAPVLLSHQTGACLYPNYVNCPVYLRKEIGPLPSDLRGSSTAPSRLRKRAAKRTGVNILIVILLFIAAGAYIFSEDLLQVMGIGSGTTSATNTGTSTLEATASQTGTIAGWTNPALVIPTKPSRTPTVNLTTSPATPTGTPTLTFTPSRTPTRTPTPTLTPSRTRTRTATATLTPTRTRTRTTTPSADPNRTRTPSLAIGRTPTPTLPSSARVCGATLDKPFGGKTKFVLHMVLSGENMNLYADTYHTTTDAILAVNYHLPMPIWKDWIIVIPYETSDVNGIPPFEPYQAVWAVLTVEELARQLDTDLQALRKFNDFDEPCTMFSGWLIVPREAQAP